MHVRLRVGGIGSGKARLWVASWRLVPEGGRPQHLMSPSLSGHKEQKQTVGDGRMDGWMDGETEVDTGGGEENGRGELQPT